MNQEDIDMLDPADPPSPLTAEEIEKVRHRVEDWTEAYPPESWIRSVANDRARLLATLDALWTAANKVSDALADWAVTGHGPHIDVMDDEGMAFLSAVKGLRATLDSARAPDAGLRAALRRWAMRPGPWRGDRTINAEMAYAAALEEVLAMLDDPSLATSPAPAGLDVDTVAQAFADMNIWGAAASAETTDTLAAQFVEEYEHLRAATRPAEDAK